MSSISIGDKCPSCIKGITFGNEFCGRVCKYRCQGDMSFMKTVVMDSARTTGAEHTGIPLWGKPKMQEVAKNGRDASIKSRKAHAGRKPRGKANTSPYMGNTVISIERTRETINEEKSWHEAEILRENNMVMKLSPEELMIYNKV